MQLLRTQVPKLPNDTADLTVFFAHSGSTFVKAVGRTLMKLSPEHKDYDQLDQNLGVHT